MPYGNAQLIADAIAANAEDIAAVIVEPVPVSPLVYIKQLSPTPYAKVQAACDDAGCALIFDESRRRDWRSGAQARA